MGFGYRRLPEEVVLGRTSKQVFEILVKHTSFPWPVMKAQATGGAQNGGEREKSAM